MPAPFCWRFDAPPWAPQASVLRVDSSAQSAERLMRGGKISCLSCRLQVIVELVSRICSALLIDPSKGKHR